MDGGLDPRTIKSCEKVNKILLKGYKNKEQAWRNIRLPLRDEDAGRNRQECHAGTNPDAPTWRGADGDVMSDDPGQVPKTAAPAWQG